jgi:histidinol-phosphate aminotransferase
MIEKLVKKKLKDFKPYKVEFVDANIRLDANESPFDLSCEVKEKILDMIRSTSELNRYPDTTSRELRKSIAEKYGCSPENIIASSGSDQMISVIINTFVDPGDAVLSPCPSFDMYRISSIIGNAEVFEYELDPENDYRYDVKLIADHISTKKPKIVFICSPNNPTGNQMDNDDIKELISFGKDSLFVIDEAYVEFAESSFTKEVLKYENAVVLRTFSKVYGIAGLRCGFSISHKDTSYQLQKALPPYNLNSFTQSVAGFVLLDEAENDRRIAFIRSERERVMQELSTLSEIKIYPTASNFFLMKVPKGINLYDEMLKRRIRIRKYKSTRLLENCYRINVGGRNENDEVIKSIFDILRSF